MRATLFFVLGLLVIANAAQQPNVFAQIEQHPFGSSLMDLVQMNMQANSQAEIKSEDSLSAISELLNDIQKDMQSSKTTGDLEHKQFQEKADEDIDNFKQVIAEQKERRTVTLKALAESRKTLADTEADLAQAQTHLASVVEQIKTADSENVEAVAAHEKKSAELRQAIAACKEAVVELNKLNTPSFIEGASINMAQIQGGMQKVQLALQKHLPARLAIFRPIVTALLEMGTNANPELVAKVVGLINDLRSALESELSTSIKTEEIRVKDYVKLRADLVVDQRATSQRIGRNQVNIKSLKASIKQSETIVAELNKTIPAAEKLLALREQQKADEQTSYEKDDASRVSELEVIKQLIELFEDKIAGMSEHMKSKVVTA